MDFKGFIGPSYHLRNFAYDCQTCVNFLLEVDETGKGNQAQPAQLTSRPGLAPVITGLTGVSRGGYSASNGKLYWVFGNKLYEITTGSGLTGWSASVKGTISAGTTPVFITDNTVDLFVLSSGQPWAMNLSTGVVSALSGGAYTSSSSMAFLDSYVVFSKVNSGQFYWTDLLDTTASALNFATAEANPDRLTGIIANSQQLWLFGKKSTEVWYNYGQNNVVFARQGNLLIETGCSSPYSIQKIGGTVIWLGLDERGGVQVNVANGYNPARVSTFALEQRWQGFTEAQLQGAIGFTMTFAGHELYLLNFPGDDQTYVYDFSSSKMMGMPIWTTFTSSDGNGTTSRFLAQGHSFHNGYHITGDFSDGILYVMDKDTFTDNSNYIQWERATPHIGNEMLRVFHDILTLYFLTGNTSTLTLDPQVMMQHSSDGGATWTDERWESCGKTGEYGLKVEYRRLGSARDRVYRIRMSDPIYWAIFGASLDVRLGSN